MMGLLVNGVEIDYDVSLYMECNESIPWVWIQYKYVVLTVLEIPLWREDVSAMGFPILVRFHHYIESGPGGHCQIYYPGTLSSLLSQCGSVADQVPIDEM